MSIFVIEDESHAEPYMKFFSLPEAVAEMKRLATLPWDQEPNKCPCTSWKTCSRDWHIIEFDDSVNPWERIQEYGYLTMSNRGPEWLGDPGAPLKNHGSI